MVLNDISLQNLAAVCTIAGLGVAIYFELRRRRGHRGSVCLIDGQNLPCVTAALMDVETRLWRPDANGCVRLPIVLDGTQAIIVESSSNRHLGRVTLDFRGSTGPQVILVP